MKRNNFLLILFTLLIISFLSGCDSLSSNISGDKNEDTIQASGVIEAEQVAISSELSGRIKEIYTQEGYPVSAGDPVFKLETDMLAMQKTQLEAQLESTAAQKEGAKAAVTAAEAGLHAAEINLHAAGIQYQQVLAEACLVEGSDRVVNWNQSTPSQFDLPAWYFQQEERIKAIEAEVSQAFDLYQLELENYQELVADTGEEGLFGAEKRLAEAQAAFEVADTLKDHQVGYEGREEIEDFVDSLYDSAESELEAAQKAYDQLLSDLDYQEILEARARVSVALERYNLARDEQYLLFTGEHSLAVQAADALVAQAEAGVIQAQAQITQAEANLKSAETAVTQAKAALDLISLQMDKLIVTSPISGVVLTKSIESGEVIQAGLTAFTVGQLDQLSVTVYLPENRYGQVKIGDIAVLTIDSFPDLSFEAEVVQIADQAEYTPRNVQTQEERQNTVYAIKLSVLNPDGQLKPGMPADVVFRP